MLQLSAHKDILVRTLVHDGSRSFRILKYLTIWWISRVFFGGGLGWQGFLGSGHVAIQFGVLPPVSHNLDGVVSGEGKLRATTRGAAHPALAPQIRFDFQDDDDDDDDDDDRSAGQLVLYYNPCTMETLNSNTFKTLRHYRFCTNDPFQVGESLIVSDCSLIYWEAPVFFCSGAIEATWSVQELNNIIRGQTAVAVSMHANRTLQNHPLLGPASPPTIPCHLTASGSMAAFQNHSRGCFVVSASTSLWKSCKKIGLEKVRIELSCIDMGFRSPSLEYLVQLSNFDFDGSPTLGHLWFVVKQLAWMYLGIDLYGEGDVDICKLYIYI